MFNFFSFKDGVFFTFGNFNKIDDIVQSLFENSDINEITELYEDAFNDYFDNTNKENEDENIDFIKFESYDDMYLLTIELKGIDLRELSIKYDSGIIEINSNRLEMSKNAFGITRKVKKHYNRKFDNVEEIDIDNLLKSVDKEMLSIRMPKKFSIDVSQQIVDIDYIDVIDADNVSLEEQNN